MEEVLVPRFGRICFRVSHLDGPGRRAARSWQVVAQGEAIAKSGDVGRSLAPHLHFHVRRGRDTIPISFLDVTRQLGVPSLGFRYRADRSALPPLTPHNSP